MVSVYYQLGIILSSIANGMFLYSILSKRKEKMFKVQFLEMALNIIKNCLLGGFTGAFIQSFGLLRNYLAYKGVKSLSIRWSLVIVSFLVASLFNREGLLGFIPIVASVGYTIVSLFTDDLLKIKIALGLNLSLWGIYAWFIRDWVSFSMTFVYLLFISYSIVSLYKDRKISVF